MNVKQYLSIIRLATSGNRPDQITKEMIRESAEYLQLRFNGEGPHTLFQRFKKVFRKATEDEIFQLNPCEGVVITIDSEQLKKDILSMDEIKQLAMTHYPNENPDIRRAFLFCLYAGLKHTEKYTRAVDSLKREAIDSLPDISF